MCVEQNAVGTPFGRWDAYTRAGFAIMLHATAPLSSMLCANLCNEK